MQVFALVFPRNVLLYVFLVDLHLCERVIAARVEGYVVQQVFNYGMQPARAYVLLSLVCCEGVLGYGAQGVVGKAEQYIISLQQRFVLLGYGVLWLGEYALIVIYSQRLKLYPYWEAALQLGYQV